MPILIFFLATRVKSEDLIKLQNIIGLRPKIGKVEIKDNYVIAIIKDDVERLRNQIGGHR